VVDLVLQHVRVARETMPPVSPFPEAAVSVPASPLERHVSTTEPTGGGMSTRLAYTAEEVAELLQLSRSSVYEHARADNSRDLRAVWYGLGIRGWPSSCVVLSKVC
jgi:predicted DNA-binding transcriptional regulator AlpA